jgi:hypothetical protein
MGWLLEGEEHRAGDVVGVETGSEIIIEGVRRRGAGIR